MRVALLCLLAVLPFARLQEPPPVADYHQHLFSPEAAALVNATAAAGSPAFAGVSAADLIAHLDAAGIRRALVLSIAYTWGAANRTVDREYDHVKGENDWTSRQVAQYPDRLRAFCSVNPLKSYAMTELERCTHDPQLNRGLKLHFANSDVDFANPANVAQARTMFRGANDRRMAIVVHMHPSISNRRAYGADAAQVFLNELLPAAPDVPVQIAHLAGPGSYDAATDAALNVFAEAIGRNDPRLRNVWFDVTGVAQPDTSSDTAQLVVKRIRQLGLARVLYGSDTAAGGNPAPREAWRIFRRLPLTDEEFRTIAANVPPYLRW